MAAKSASFLPGPVECKLVNAGSYANPSPSRNPRYFVPVVQSYFVKLPAFSSVPSGLIISIVYLNAETSYVLVMNDKLKSWKTLHDNLRVYPAACPNVDLVRPMLRLQPVAVETLPPVAEPLAGVIAAEGAAAVDFQLPHH